MTEHTMKASTLEEILNEAEQVSPSEDLPSHYLNHQAKFKELKVAIDHRGSVARNPDHSEASVQSTSSTTTPFFDTLISLQHLGMSHLCCEHIHRPGTPPPDGKCCYHCCRPTWTLEERERNYGKEVFMPQAISNVSSASNLPAFGSR